MGIGMSKLVNRVMPRGLQHWQRKLGPGARAEIQVLSLMQRGLKVVPGAQEARIWTEQRIEFLQEDPHILRAQLVNLQQLVANSPTGQHSLDASGRILTVNPMWTKVLGYEEAEVRGREIFDFIVPEQRANAKARFRARMLGTKLPPKNADREYLAADGKRVKAITFDTVIRDENETALGVITSFIDITRLREVEEELKKAREAIIKQERYAAVADLATTMSHSIKNLLAASIGDAEALKNMCATTQSVLLMAEAAERVVGKTGKDELPVVRKFLRETRKLVCSLEKSLTAMNENAEGLLDYARRRTTPRKPVSVLAVVEDVLESLARFASSKGVVLVPDIRKVELDDGVFVHEDDLAKLVRNLVKNAIESYTNGKASLKNKKVKIIVSKVVNGHSNRFVLGVFDEGIGMSQARVKELKRAATGGIASFKAGGSGFGFLTVKRIVERAGGKIDINSAEEGYTRMVVQLPLAEEKATLVKDKKVGASSIRYLRRHLSEITVMLIEDQVTIKETFEQVLKAMGFKVISFVSAKEALRAYRNSSPRPQIVITDWKMPISSGQELIEEIWSLEGEEEPELVIISGNDKDPDVQQFSEANSIPVFAKGKLLEDFRPLVLAAAGKILGEEMLEVSEAEVIQTEPFMIFGKEMALLAAKSLSFAEWFELDDYSMFAQEIQEGYGGFLNLLDAFEQIIANPQASLPNFLRGNETLIKVFDLVPAEERYKLALVLDICLNQGLRELRDYLADGWQDLPKDEIRVRVEKTSSLMRAMQLENLQERYVFLTEQFQALYDLLGKETNPSQAE